MFFVRIIGSHIRNLRKNQCTARTHAKFLELNIAHHLGYFE